ncbi:MAG: response regulator [Calditrichae bacterium]|nr:response regulator [Calditrichota bacterium]MCB9059391.1 response regulator [Calditrichia bacterium]
MRSKKTILIVEDEDSILLALQRILELTGEYEAIIAQDGQQALEVLNGVIPDLIISDISMPNLNGLDFCKIVRENPVTTSIPFIFLTAKREKMIEGLSAGGDDFLMKPFNVEEVLAKIETIFRRISQSREQASQHKGRIEDVPVEQVLELCLREKINGELILQLDGDIGVVKLENGDIKSVLYKQLSDDAALDSLRSWEKGTFVIRPLEIKFKVESHKKLSEMDLLKEQKLKDKIWWVGHYNKIENELQNVYLRVFEFENKKINALVDPGSPLYFDDISKKINQVLGDFSKVNISILLDPTADASLNIMLLRKANAKSIFMTNEQNWQTIRHYEINPRSVKKINPEENDIIKLASGHQLQFISSAYCPAHGSFMSYDIDQKVLFSGLLFSSDYSAGMNNTENIYATESDWEAMRRFHSKHMPSSTALSNVLEKIRALSPKPDIIAPRYGKIITGDLVDYFMDRLALLRCGVDKENNLREHKTYIDAMNTLLGRIQGFLPLETSIQKLSENTYIAARSGFSDGLVYEISGNPGKLYFNFINTLMKDESEKNASQIKSAALKIAYSAGINLPDF